MKPLRTWIVVADGARAKFLHFAGRKIGARTIAGQTFSRHAKPTRELGTDKPGRTFESKGQGRHAVEPRVDMHEREEEAFLSDVIRRLEEAFEAGAFGNLILIAPPRALGILRRILPKRIRPHVSFEIDSDYTHYSDDEITRAVIEQIDGLHLKSA